MVQILDQFGNPVSSKRLTQEEAGPTLGGVRSIAPLRVSSRMTPEKLLRLMAAADEGDPFEYLALAEEIEEKEPHYTSVLGTRRRAVAQMEITVEAASSDPVDEENAQMVRDLLDRDTIEDEIFDILDAIGKGFSANELIWDMSERQWSVKNVIWRDPRWFRFDRVDGTTLRLRSGAADLDLTPFKYIIHTHKSKSGLPIRGGIVRPCAWMWLFKNFSIKDWVVFSEAYGQPIRIGKYDPASSEKDREVLLRAVTNIGSDLGAIIPESMTIEFIESMQKQSTIAVYQQLIEMCDKQMSKAVLGQTTTTDSVPGNGFAGNASHNDVRGDIGRSDAKQLAATLNEQLVKPFIMLNKGPQAKYPRLRIGQTDDVDVAALSDAAVKFVGMGGKVSASELGNKLGLPAPKDDEDTLKPPQNDFTTGGFAQPGFSQPAAQPSFAQQSRAVLAAQRDQADGIGDLADELSSDWEQLNPIVDQLVQAAESSSSYEEFAQRLLEIAPKLDLDPSISKLAQAVFAARLAGNLKVDLTKK